jgi:hypothetical protein
MGLMSNPMSHLNPDESPLSTFLTCEEGLRKVDRQRESSIGCPPRYIMPQGSGVGQLPLALLVDNCAVSL